MEVMWVLLIFTLVAGDVKAEIVKSRPYKITYTKVLSDALKAQQWDGHEGPCLDTMLKIMDHADNFTLWAVWILDSFTRPAGHLNGQMFHLGNYDECLNPSSGFEIHHDVPQTQYCLMHVTLTETEASVSPYGYMRLGHDVTTEVYLKKPTKHGRLLSKMVWGVCVPEVCGPASTAKIARSVLQTSHLGALSDSATFNVSQCHRADELTFEMPMLFFNFILLLLLTTLFCTYYVKNSEVTNRTFVSELARSFCLSRNMESLTVVREDEVTSMNFYRLVACFVVVYIHYAMFTFIVFPTEGTEMERMLDEGGYTSTHGDLVVDVFLTLSGVLFTKGILSDKWQNPIKFVWKRYIRLAAPLAAILFYMATTSGRIGNGPLWHYEKIEQNLCANSWWINLFMFVNITNIDKLCNLSTWYVPCDYQLCVFATILYVVYKKNKTAGKIAFAVSLALSMIIPALITYINEFPAIPFSGIESVMRLLERNGVVWWDTYIPSYCRAGPFVVGMAMGYTIHTYKPKDHRRVIGRLPSYLALILSAILSFAVCACGFHYYSEYEPVGGAIYAGVHRAVWGVAVCLVIGVAEYGELPLLTRLFSWRPLAPLSRLTYGVYLTHVPMLRYIHFTTRTTLTPNMFTMSVAWAGLMVFCLTASLALWLLMEAPLININNMLLDHTWSVKSIKSNGVSCNGQKKLS
ncbi:nose resistant to fluoxetine protein 6-like [Plodia interpunctella]|uniref:nose resistant to fluoxetine protein 6-like n=1 Tax=Plodia interpunctella TaxID=58824 RepID=UPI0023685386|nr:nose resistant to fluoxetine protein 6-like [Plodia interpunctella]